MGDKTTTDTPTIDKSTLLLYYKREDIQQEMVRYAKDKEVAVKYGSGGFGKRPDILKYPTEVIELVKQGATSFHCSEEHWNQVLQISPEMNPRQLDEVRKGWDLVLDIDCKELDVSKIAADLVIKAIKHHGIKSVSCKFSGNHGFHIGVPFEAFPSFVGEVSTVELFPEGPRKIAEYLQSMIENHLRGALLERYSVDELAGMAGKKFEEIVINNEFDPFTVVDIDTILIASRHLYRMPYSFNEKSGLISVVINPDKVLEFNKAIGIPKQVRVSRYIFLDKEGIVEGEGTKLLVQALDHKLKVEEKELEQDKAFEELEEKTPEELFPPCVQLIGKGLKDGKKRAVFVLINFLSRAGWSYDDIEEYLKDWNKKNPEPLREVSLLGQLRYHKLRKKKILPPNCANNSYYADMGCCKPDNLCQKIKNPVSYVRRKVMFKPKKEEEKVVKVKNVKKDGKDMKKGKQIDKNTPSETPKPL